LRVRSLALLPLLFVVFLELEVIKIKSLCLRRLFDVFDRASGLVLVILLPEELRMLIPQVDIVRVRVVLEEFREFLRCTRLLSAENERFKAGGGLVLSFRYSVNDLLLFLGVRREGLIGDRVKVPKGDALRDLIFNFLPKEGQVRDFVQLRPMRAVCLLA
jgi:hypothetical protein